MNRSLSVIIPAYKEEKRIGVTLSSLERYFTKHDHFIEVIVVDDGSPDNTKKVVAKYQKRMPYLKFIQLPENRGKGYAVKTGMLAATGDMRLFMDADNSVDIGHLDRFLTEHDHGFDVVIGSIELPGARIRENNGIIRRTLSRVSKIPVRILATPGIHDTQRGFKLFSANAAHEIFPRQTIDRFGFDIELLMIAGARKLTIKEIPVKWVNPTGSTVSSGDYYKTLVELFRIVINNFQNKYDRIQLPVTSPFGTTYQDIR